MTKFSFKGNKNTKFPRKGGDTMSVWQNDAEPVRVELERTPPISLEEATGHPVSDWGKGEEPNPKPEPRRGEDYPITVSP